MDRAARTDIMNWLTSAGLTGLAETELLRGFCERCRAAGFDLSRALVFIDTLHPIFEGRGFRWTDIEINESDTFEYGSSSSGEGAANWQRSPFFAMLERGHGEMRIDLERPRSSDFSMVGDLAGKGHKDCVLFIHRFGDTEIIGDMDCVYSYWLMRDSCGFDAAERLEALRELVPLLGLAVKACALTRVARTLGHVYLGRDAAERVLHGRISRGVADRINAVLWYSDLRGFTAISEAMPPAELIPFLNDYADAAIGAIHDAGGDVLKLIGDGVLAIFNPDDMVLARQEALRAEHEFRKAIRDINQRRSGANRLITTAYVSLHVGEVFYGNIGSDERLDFTVVGPAVNEVSRIAAMCNSVDRELLVSSTFLAGLDPAGRDHFVSTGRFALRGIGRAQDLFTLDPEIRTTPPRAERYDRYLSRAFASDTGV
ncbi:adenylate/guanylate cyclase domain-containing protein [Bradyrhizobium sp. 2TAF24]|uniref:adenylate/guanylate cyclase domain-containing protein n=1 Tax=Bradyrhizobium sp. 2TAF24 TaxID=3233011 RepID=UPI003F9190C2